MDIFTPRNAAKFVVQAVVAGKTAQFAEEKITDYTALEKDTMVVDISGHLVGWYVSHKLKPYTDAAVDKTADWIVAYKAKKSEKKKNTEEEK